MEVNTFKPIINISFVIDDISETIIQQVRQLKYHSNPQVKNLAQIFLVNLSFKKKDKGASHVDCC